MPVQRDDGFYCQICNSGPYKNALYATSCEKGHDLIYVPFTRDDLYRLAMFVATGNRELISESLGKTLKKYSSNLSK